MRPLAERAARPMVLVAILIASSVLAGCVDGRASLLVAVSAPKESGGVTLFAVREAGIGAPDVAEYDIRYGGRVIYPPSGKGAEFKVSREGASVFVPYSLFVVGNGEYEARVRYNGEEIAARFPVAKWVNYVFLHPFDRGARVDVDVQLSRTTGGLPNDRVLTEGDLVLEVHYRGQDGKRDKLLNPPIKVTTDGSSTFTRVEVPRSRLSEGPGYYSFEPVFHNKQAKGNLWVPADPTMEDRNPPWNWIYVSR